MNASLPMCEREKVSRARKLLTLGNLDAARGLAEEAATEPNASADAHSLLANILDRCGEWRASLTHLRRAHDLMPNAPQVRLNLAMALLRLDHYREGLELYEARLDKPAWSGFATVESRTAGRHRLLRPGQPVDGRRIVLLAEQGLGDGIMCARYVPMLAQRGARIALASNPTLRPFFARIPEIETLLSPPADQPLAQINLAVLPFDAWLPLFSLPYWFGTELLTIPAQFPYWRAEPDRVAYWRDRFAAAGRQNRQKIGLVFQTQPAGAGFLDRSMQAADLAPVLALDSFDFVNLQRGEAGKALAALAPNTIDILPPDLPLDDYAAALAATDLLLTVDTMAVHLAGAMAHPTWLVVPYSPQWTWGLFGGTSPWYPAVRIFRQVKDRDWSGAVAAIIAGLNEKLRLPRGGRQHAGISVQTVPLADPIPRSKRPEPDACAAAVTPARNPGHEATARLELALAQLRRGEFEEGFANYEARQDIPLWSEQAMPLRESLTAVEDRRLKPGDPVHARRIAVFTEQGLGDTFLAARFLHVLAGRGAAITLVCRAPMRPFFARLPFLHSILSPPDDKPHAKIDMRQLSFDAFCPLLSLPHALGIARDAARPGGPYMSADPGQVAAWLARYERQGRRGHRKVGVVWRANASNAALANRSLRAEDLAPLAQIEGVDLVNLQHGPAGRDLAHIAPYAIDATQAPLTLDEFAAAVAATDLVISVDTMAAHCAGALNHPVFVLLPDEPGWWWGSRNSTSMWYPSARLFQCGGSSWAGAIEDAVVALRSEPVLRERYPHSARVIDDR